MKFSFGKKAALFLEFFGIGAFTVGGGYAMIPLIRRDVAEKRGWIDGSEMIDIVAVSESTPGPIAINAATFVGYRVAGFGGAFFATLGVVLPSFIVILIVSYLLGSIAGLETVRYAFAGVRAAIIALILKALLDMLRQCPKNLLSALLAAGAFAAVTFAGVNAVFAIVGGALIGLACAFAARRGGGKK